MVSAWLIYAIASGRKNFRGEYEKADDALEFHDKPTIQLSRGRDSISTFSIDVQFPKFKLLCENVMYLSLHNATLRGSAQIKILRLHYDSISDLDPITVGLTDDELLRTMWQKDSNCIAKALPNDAQGTWKLGLAVSAYDLILETTKMSQHEELVPGSKHSVVLRNLGDIDISAGANFFAPSLLVCLCCVVTMVTLNRCCCV